MGSASKREEIERLLAEGMVMVYLDGRRPGVRVPPALRGEAQLRLNLSYRFASRDLAVGDDFVSCTLSFNGQSCYCVLPVDAIFAVTSHVTGEALVWPESLAAALETQLPTRGPLAAVAPPMATGDKSVAGGGGASDAQVPRPARGHLHLVK